MKNPDAGKSIACYAELAQRYDRSCSLVMPIRHEAVAALGLRAGDTVLDVACGTGLSLPLLRRRVGPGGRVIGVEHSPEMIALARRRVREAGWRNVDLIQDSMEAASLGERVDAVLFHFTHDVLQSPSAVENVVRASRPGARFACAGTKFTSWWLAPVNLWVAWRARSYLTTFANLTRPWHLLLAHSPDLRVESRLLDTAYVANGTFATPGAPLANCPS